MGTTHIPECLIVRGDRHMPCNHVQPDAIAPRTGYFVQDFSKVPVTDGLGNQSFVALGGGGFGRPTTLLEFNKPAHSPGLTVDVAEQELAIQEQYERNLFMDDNEEGWDD